MCYETRCKTRRTSAKVRAMKLRKIFRNEGTRSTPLDPKLMFFCVSYYLTRSRVRICRNEGALSTRLDPKLIFWYISYNLGAKRAELVQKFVPRSRVGIFRNERTRSTPLDPYLMFRCVSYYVGAFGSVYCVTAKVRATKSRRFLSQRTHPIHPIGL